MSKVNRYKAQITQQMDDLQSMMEDNLLLRKPEIIEQALENLTFKWHFISEEDRDYIQGVQYALEEQVKWK
jgi:hypothetical protein